MPRYIDADALLEKLRNDLPFKASVRRVLMQAPTVDAVEVVRCKDCAECDHCYPRKDKGGEAIEGYYCYYHKRWVSASYYCGDGERREQ